MIRSLEINNIITGSKNITLTKVNVKPYEFDKTYSAKDLIEDKFYEILDQWKEKYDSKVLFNTFKRNTSTLWCKW